MTEVKESTIAGAGRGVFATQKFHTGDVVCFYDSYKPQNVLTPEETQYSICTKQGTFVGYKTPRSTSGVAQLINDGGVIAPHEASDDLTKLYIALVRDIEQYLSTTALRRNVGNVGLNCFALRDIEPGEELFYSYGIGYWFGDRIQHLKLNSNEYHTFLQGVGIEDLSDPAHLLLFLKHKIASAVSFDVVPQTGVET